MAFLENAVLAALMVNATHYVDIGGNTAAVIYYENATTAHMRLPDGKTFSGQWKLADDGYHVAWTNGPQGDWKLSYSPGRIGYVDATGKDHGPVTRIVYGDPEQLAQ